MLKWKPENELGIPGIDRQHKILVGLINDVMVLKEDPTNMDRVNGLFDRLVFYAREHFMHEEILMEMFDYEGLVPHRKAHQEFLEKIDRIRSRSREDGKIIISEVSSYLYQWFTNHDQGMDRGYIGDIKVRTK